MCTCRAVALAAWCIAFALSAISLQGCSDNSGDQGTSGSSTSPQRCPEATFKGNGRVEEARLGERVKVVCPTGYVYNGPSVECSWVDRFCFADDAQKVDPEFCFDQYGMTLQGEGLSKWPIGVSPRITPLPDAGVAPSVHHIHVDINSSDQSSRVRADANLPNVITPDSLPCSNEPYAELKFESAQIELRNSSSADPPWSLRYKGITTSGGNPVDLLITTDRADFSRDSARTRAGYSAARININSSDEIPFKFRFVYSGTENPIVLPKAFFTFFDIIGSQTGTISKQLKVSGIADYRVSKQTLVRVNELIPDQQYAFGDTIGSGAAPPPSTTCSNYGDVAHMSVKDLWLDTLDRAAVFVFRSISEFVLSVTVASCVDGRDLEFMGWTEVAEVGQRVVCNGVERQEDQTYSFKGIGFCTDSAGQEFDQYRMHKSEPEDCPDVCTSIAQCVGFTREVWVGDCVIHTAEGQIPSYSGTWDAVDASRIGTGYPAGSTGIDKWGARCYSRVPFRNGASLRGTASGV